MDFWSYFDSRIAVLLVAITSALAVLVSGVALRRSSKAEATWSPVVANIIQALAFFSALLGAVSIYNSWYDATKRARLETTFRFIEPLTRQDYIHALWRLQEFTVCFENERAKASESQALKHISYLSKEEVLAVKDAAKEIARAWWKAIENEEETVCDKKDGPFADKETVQAQLMLVYARISQLDVCRRRGLCDFAIIFDMRDSIDFVTLQAITNYMRFADEVSREWFMVSMSDGQPIFVAVADEMYEKETKIIARQRDEIWKAYTAPKSPEASGN